MSDPIVHALTATGAPFEYTNANVQNKVSNQEVNCKVFKQALPSLSHLYNDLATHGDTELAVYQGRRLNYRDAYQQAAKLADFLANNFSIGQGSRVALVMRNCPEWLVSFIAITSLGAVPALVNSRGAANEISHAVEQTQCRLLLLDHKTAAVINQHSVAQCPNLVFDISRNFTASHDGKVILTTTAPEEQSNLELPSAECDPDDVALILFTSGTTGHPKGVLLSHRGVLNALKANEFSGAIIGAKMAAKFGIDLETLAANQPQASTLLMFPLFHVSGCYSVFLTSLLRGGKLVMLSKWEAESALATMQNEKVTQFYGVPTMYWDILNTESLDTFDLSALQSMSVAGQSTPVSLLKKINAAFPHAMMGSGYGMTETNGVISMIIGEEFLAQPESVGHPLSIAEIKIVDDNGRAVQNGHNGEICVRGATVMLGYDNQPEANQQCFSDGWLHTGDVGYLDEQGRLFVVDRITEMVISSGENIYCAEVERVLNQAPDVLEATTFGLPDDRLGERLIALVRLHQNKQNKETLAREIIEWSSQHLASYKLPAELIVIDHPLERNATGKVLKAKAKTMYHQLSSNETPPNGVT